MADMTTVDITTRAIEEPVYDMKPMTAPPERAICA